MTHFLCIWRINHTCRYVCQHQDPIARDNGTPDEPICVAKGQSVIIPVLENDGTPEGSGTDDEGDPITLDSVDPGSRGIAGKNGPETVTYDATAIGTDSFKYYISDDRGGVAEAFINLAVKNACHVAKVTFQLNTSGGDTSAAADTLVTPLYDLDGNPNQGPYNGLEKLPERSLAQLADPGYRLPVDKSGRLFKLEPGNITLPEGYRLSDPSLGEVIAIDKDETTLIAGDLTGQDNTVLLSRSFDDVVCDPDPVTIDPNGQTTLRSQPGDRITSTDPDSCAFQSWVLSPAHTNFNGVTWIWKDRYIADPTVSDSATFQKTFDLGNNASDVKATQLTFGVDNFYDISLNGTSLAEFSASDAGDDPNTAESCNDGPGGCSFTQPITIDDSDVNFGNLLTDGLNVLTFKVTNEAFSGASDYTTNPAGLAYSFTIDTTSSATTMQEPPVADSTILSRGRTSGGEFKFTLDGSASSGDGDLTYQWNVEQVTARGDDGIPIHQINNPNNETTTFVVYDGPCDPSRTCQTTFDIDLTVSNGAGSTVDNNSSAVVSCFGDPNEFCAGTSDNDDNADDSSDTTDDGSGGGDGGSDGDPEITPTDGGGDDEPAQ
jgi:hypothetical protein